MGLICRWDESKNTKLAQERGVSFQEIELCIEENQFKIVDHPNRAKYPQQRMFVVRIKGYIYLVPFVGEGDEVFLKTIIPSRKWNKMYLEGETL